MKRLATITAAAALFAMLTLPQVAQARDVYVPYAVNQPTVQVGVPSCELGGATVYSDGSFSNNGVSWNGADPTGGWAGARFGGRFGNRFDNRFANRYGAYNVPVAYSPIVQQFVRPIVHEIVRPRMHERNDFESRDFAHRDFRWF